MKFLKKQLSPKNSIFVSLFGGVLIGSFLTWVSIDSQNKDDAPIRVTDKTMPLVRPLLAYDTPEMKSTSHLKSGLKDILDVAVSNKQITIASVYYRDLNSGRWFGINQDETFAPASLFKVPVMITYLKDAENDPSLLQKLYLDDLTADANIQETVKPLKSVVQGDSYTVEQLLKYMIEYSDNNATEILFKHSNLNTMNKVFSDLDIPSSATTSDFISVDTYSFFFRVLYNGTYISHEMSEKGLEMLSKIDFEDGIRKSLPSNVTVADKFGEYYLINGLTESNRELHDCGIVYHPKHPYILCVMTKGDSIDGLKKVIQSISKKTYDSVESMK